MIAFEFYPASFDDAWTSKWSPRSEGRAASPQEVDQYKFLFSYFYVELDLTIAEFNIKRRRPAIPVVDLMLTFDLIKKSLTREGFTQAATSEDQLKFVCQLDGGQMLIRAQGYPGEARILFDEFLDFHQKASIRTLSMLYDAHGGLRENPYLAHVEEVLDVVGMV